MKKIPTTATNIEINFDGENTVVQYMNGKRANYHSFIGEYKIVNNKIVKNGKTENNNTERI